MLLFLFFLLAQPAVVQAQDFTYVTNKGTITITGYTGPGGAVTIPSTTNGLPVTSIGDNAFAWLGNPTSVTISDSVTNIGVAAFSYSPITSVILPNRLTSIKASTFQATWLTNVTIPNSVTSIGSYAFGGCERLTNVTLGNGVSSILNDAFDGCSTLTSVTVPNSVRSIDMATFANCPSLTSVHFLGNAPTVGPYVFDGYPLPDP